MAAPVRLTPPLRLSVQVHPGDGEDGPRGKTGM
jgi:hypothetical protein